MAGERVSVGRAPTGVRAELRDALHDLDQVLTAGGEPDATQLVALRDALTHARGAIDSQQRVIGELTESIQTLARQLLESHARFAEWTDHVGQPPAPGVSEP